MSWTRHGECNGCGHCCEFVAREVLVRTPEQVARDAAFYRARGFQPVTVDGQVRHVLWAWVHAPCPELRTTVTHWTYGTETRHRCAIHEAKPETCAAFPRLPQDIAGTPCSYWFEDGDGRRVGGTGSPHPVGVEALQALEEAS